MQSRISCSTEQSTCRMVELCTGSGIWRSARRRAVSEVEMLRLSFRWWRSSLSPSIHYVRVRIFGTVWYSTWVRTAAADSASLATIPTEQPLGSHCRPQPLHTGDVMACHINSGVWRCLQRPATLSCRAALRQSAQAVFVVRLGASSYTLNWHRLHN